MDVTRHIGTGEDRSHGRRPSTLARSCKRLRGYLFELWKRDGVGGNSLPPWVWYIEHLFNNNERILCI
jgi:hypothetical protein